MHYELYIPFPPTINSYYTKTQRGVFISNKGRKFRAEVLTAMEEQLPGVCIEERCLVEVVLYPPDRRVRDVDNYNKPLLDAFTKAGLWSDDSLVDQLFNYRGEVHKPSGSCFVRITDAGPLLKVGQSPPMD